MMEPDLPQMLYLTLTADSNTVNKKLSAWSWWEHLWELMLLSMLVSTATIV